MRALWLGYLYGSKAYRLFSERNFQEPTCQGQQVLVDLQRGPMSRSKHSSSLGTDCHRSKDHNNLSLNLVCASKICSWYPKISWICQFFFCSFLTESSRTLMVEESPLMSGLARLVSYTVQYVDIYILKLDNRQGILCRSGCIPPLIEHTLD